MGDPKRILVIQLKRAGDVIVTTPVLSALRDRFPSAHIGFLVDKPFSPLLANHPAVDSVSLFNRDEPWKTWREIRAAKFDWVFDFQSSPRSAPASLLSGASVVAGYRVPFWGRFYGKTIKRPGGAQSVVEGKLSLVESVAGAGLKRFPRLVALTATEKAWATSVMPSERTIGMVPTHRRESRRWHADSFVSVGRHWRSQGFDVRVFWGPGEEAYARSISSLIEGSSLIPPTSLREMAALLASCQVVITNDNGPMHLAVAVGVPTVTIYGPTDPTSWNPGGDRHAVLRAEGLSCLGCNLNQCPFAHECMTWVTPQTVIEASARLVEAGYSSAHHE